MNYKVNIHFPDLQIFFARPTKGHVRASSYFYRMFRRTFISASLVTCILIFCRISVPAQVLTLAGVIKDSHSEEPVPFASVSFKNSTVGKLADSAGTFVFHLSHLPSDTLVITSVGYQPFYLAIAHNKDSLYAEILMERGTFTNGVMVRSKVNKGLFVWRKIVEHKPLNNRYRFTNFSYELYNKLELDLKHVNFDKLGKLKPLRPITTLINQNIDTSEGLRYLPAYLTEVLSDYYFQKSPEKRREVIKAVNTNGVKNESAVKFLGGMDQVVNVYNNFIPVFDRELVSPISDNGDYYYNYSVVDTQVINNRRFYHLVFTPRRKGGDTFEGDCWVNVGSWAIQKMNLRLGKEANVNFVDNLSLIQEYSLINDSTWFLSKDKFVVDLSPAGKDRPGFIGRKTTTYRNVLVNDSSVANEVLKNKSLEDIITLPGAVDKSRAFWDTARHEPLTKTEGGIIKMIDTLTAAPVFKKFTKTAGFIGTGYRNVGNYEIGPWFNWLTSNGWEGTRVRFDIGTNKYFNQKIKLHTYLAYGFGDKKFKGFGEFFYLPKKDPRMYVYGSYTNDLDFGQNYLGEVTSDNFFAFYLRKKNIPRKYINIDEKRFEFFKEMTPWMSNQITAIHKQFNPLLNLLPADSFGTTVGKPFTTFEIQLQFHFAYLERFLESHFYRSSLGSPYPIAELNISHGFPRVLNSSYEYTKVSLNISHNMKIPPYGTLSWYISAGKTFGTLPYPFLNIAPGNELHYYDKYSYDMMNRWEFIHDKYVGINIEHNIGNGIFRLIPKLRFRQFWTAKALWGSLTPANKALNFKMGNSFQSLDGNTYLELGTGIDNILHVFRIDFVWRVFPYTLKKEGDKTFGIFGSFRFDF